MLNISLLNICQPCISASRSDGSGVESLNGVVQELLNPAVLGLLATSALLILSTEPVSTLLIPKRYTKLYKYIFKALKSKML